MEAIKLSIESRYELDCDIKAKSTTNIGFKQGDVDSSVLEVNLKDSKQPIDITGEVIEFRFLKADKTIVFQDSTSGVNILYATDGKIECVLRSDTLASPGVVVCEIHRSKDGKSLTTPSFTFTVSGSIEGGFLSTNYISAIESTIAGITTAEAIRATSEVSRSTAETARSTAETSRVSADSARASQLALQENIKGTNQFIIFNGDGTVQKVQHKDGLSALIREDVFTYATNLITEVRTLTLGGTLTLINHLDTLETEVV